MGRHLLLLGAVLFAAVDARAKDPPKVELPKLKGSPPKHSNDDVWVSITLTAEGEIYVDARKVFGRIPSEPGKARNLDEVAAELNRARRLYKLHCKFAGKPWKDANGWSLLRVRFHFDRQAHTQHAQLVATVAWGQQLHQTMFGARFGEKTGWVRYHMSVLKHHQPGSVFIDNEARAALEIMKDGSYVVKGKKAENWDRAVKALKGKEPVSIAAPDGARFEAVLQAFARLHGLGRRCYLVPRIPTRAIRSAPKLPPPS